MKAVCRRFASLRLREMWRYREGKDGEEADLVTRRTRTSKRAMKPPDKLPLPGEEEVEEDGNKREAWLLARSVPLPSSCPIPLTTIPPLLSPLSCTTTTVATLTVTTTSSIIITYKQERTVAARLTQLGLMKTNFTGSTRRPRQVNLSGKSRASPTLSGPSAKGVNTSTSVATARELRARRESERQRNAAAVTIQSTYRGHASRIALRNNNRDAWDKSVGFKASSVTAQSGPTVAASNIDAIALLLLFCEPTNPADLERLFFTISAFNPDSSITFVTHNILQSGGRARFLITRLSRKIVTALSTLSTKPGYPIAQQRLPFFLLFIAQTGAYLPNFVDESYFSLLAQLISNDFLNFVVPTDPISFGRSCTTPSAAFLQAIVLALQSSITSADRPLIYARFVQVFLSSPSLNIKLFPRLPVRIFSNLLDLRQLLDAICELRFTQLGPEKALWLLSYLVSLVQDSGPAVSTENSELENQILSHHLYQPVSPENQYSHSATLFGPIFFALDSLLEMYNNDGPHMTDATSATSTFDPPEYIKDQLNRLLGTSIIQHLVDLTRSDIPAEASSPLLRRTRYVAQSFTLRCLLYFRFLRQRFHNRLFLARSTNGSPLLSELFSQIQNSKVFQNGMAAPKDILEGLKLTYNRKSSGLDHRYAEWTSIFLFLDLYCFASVVVDDEEFFSFQDKSLTQYQLRALVAFLKNLAYVTYFEVSEIESQHSGEPLWRPLTTEDRIQNNPRWDIAGSHGITLPWLRNLVVRILRSLHRRDSRQSFLAGNLWLMADVDLEGSTLLIAEEEARQQQPEELDEAGDSDSEDGSFETTTPSQPSSFIKRREKDLRHNYLAAITPRLEILQNLPFLIPFRTRVTIFRDFVRLDQQRRGTGDHDFWRLNQANPLMDHHSGNTKHHGVIRRDHVFEDAYDEFYALGDGFKEPIQITFVDSFGAEEPGIDGGGILKEFLSSIVQESYRNDPAQGVPFFSETEGHLLYPNPTLLDQISWGLYKQNQRGFHDIKSEVSHEVSELLKRFEFLGRIIGKCMYEGILVDVAFADFFLLKWSKVSLGNEDLGLGVDDLKSLDRSLWKGLQSLKYYDDHTIENLELTFTTENIFQLPDSLALNGVSKKITLVDLKPGGSQLPVTSSNRLEYIHLLSRYKLVTQGKLQTNAFLKGLSSIISPRWLSMFNQSELQTLVGGNESPLDISDLRRNTVYGGIYTIGDDNQEHPTIEMFWSVMERLEESDKRAVLKFVTSVSRAPLLGFGSLNPKFSIRDAGSDPTRLPSTSTCVNLLKLPRYQSEHVLEEKLLYAANAGAGFDLS
ncbi:hypothetical protein H072_5778 [Dactylellina haptotyla CBS 200.50]|uniref:HECT-type E3 ubiquitin transferase n=1 Tax=Dactylellina haptotyla (strain CBS 200.50) TaxID=1284197 RepID=S8BYJ9_DACHA|nr:hypothetical protein H072_5778 [Dactylellina haptotyla CBS 200.50]